MKEIHRLSFPVVLFCAVSALGQSDTVRMRGLADTVGFAHTAEQIEEVIRLCGGVGADLPSAPWIAGISPHDDYLYAGPVYMRLLPGILAKRVVLFGVAHKAADCRYRDRLIFDDFTHWRGPYGPVPVDPLRGRILEEMDSSAVLISGDFHSREHSLEALIPFLQTFRRDVSIIPILVPHMGWERMDELARVLSRILAAQIVREGWTPGEDIAFLISTDCVHYGDEDWGGKNYAPFGSDRAGYDKAVSREYGLIHRHLTGRVDPDKSRSLLYTLVDENDVASYRITWCGRFSIPMGLDVLHHLMKELNRDPLEGILLRVASSISQDPLDVESVGLGRTAKADLHHWVGYCAVGYR